MSTSPDAPAHGHLRIGSLSLRCLFPEATCPTSPLERIWLLQVGAGLLPRVEAWLTGRGRDVGGLGAAARDPPPCPVGRDGASLRGERVRPRGRMSSCPRVSCAGVQTRLLPGRCSGSVQTDPPRHAATAPHSASHRGSGAEAGAPATPLPLVATPAAPAPQPQGPGARVAGLTLGLAPVPTDSTTGMTRGVRRSSARPPSTSTSS